ncbi:MAG: DUF4339 domain-containing protein [Nonlabens sp.]|nr:DUF4339 domain-containing protein [Nonlabens sp.]
MTQSSQNTEYYLVVDNQQQGPFTVSQLAARNITPESLVWTVGMENWVTASSVPALVILFKKPEPSIPVANITPPAVTKEATSNAQRNVKPVKSNLETSYSNENLKPTDTSQPVGFIAAIRETMQEKRFKYGAFVVIGIIALAGILEVGKSIKKSNLAEKNKQTEERNIKAEQSLESLALQAAAAQEEERKEQERREKEITESVKRRVSEINVEITMQEEELVLARQKFSEVTATKLFRSAATRSEEVNAAMDQIKYHENEIERLKKEIKTVELNGERAIEGRNY